LHLNRRASNETCMKRAVQKQNACISGN